MPAGSGSATAALAEVLKDVGAAVTGYRAQLIEAGWPQVIADQVAGAALMTWQNRLLTAGQ